MSDFGVVGTQPEWGQNLGIFGAARSQAGAADGFAWGDLGSAQCGFPGSGSWLLLLLPFPLSDPTGRLKEVQDHGNVWGWMVAVLLQAFGILGSEWVNPGIPPFPFELPCQVKFPPHCWALCTSRLPSRHEFLIGSFLQEFPSFFPSRFLFLLL